MSDDPASHDQTPPLVEATATPATDEATRAAPPPADGGVPPSPRAMVDLLIADLAAMIRFYSRLPIPKLSPADDPAGAPPFGRAIRMLPWASLVIALPAALVVAVLGDGALPQAVVATLAVTAMAITTGAFHEDGIADVADGFYGGATKERRLEIMKDSRIGAFGGVALVAQFALRAGLIAEAIDRFDGAWAGFVILAVAAVARVAPLMLMVALPPARADGLGRAAGTPQTPALGYAAAGAAVIAVSALLAVVDASDLLAALALTIAAILGLGLIARAKIGGFTGDLVGAGTIVAEIAAMVGVLM